MANIIGYTVAGDIEVYFEYEPSNGFREAGLSRLQRRVRDAVSPAVNAAGEVLDRFKGLSPDEVALTFGIKVTGEANWIVAKAGSEANFEVTLTWRPKAPAEAAEAITDQALSAETDLESPRPGDRSPDATGRPEPSSAPKSPGGDVPRSEGQPSPQEEGQG